MRVEIKTKYTKIFFNEDFDAGQEILYVSVDFAWEKDANPLASLFGCMWDTFVQSEVRRRLAEELGINPEKDIALEDITLLIQGFSQDEKHIAVKVVPIVQACEAEFDRMLNFLPTSPA